MSIQTPEQALAVLNQFFVKHKEICQDDFNVAVLSGEIMKHFSVAGEVVLSESTLELALLNVGAQLHYYADPSTTARIQQVSQQALESQQRLAEELAEKNRQAAALERDQLREQRQMSHGPGVVSAFGNGADAARRASEEQQARQAVRDQAIRNEQHQQFVAELHRANQIQIVMPGGGMVAWGKTNDARASAKKLCVGNIHNSPVK